MSEETVSVGPTPGAGVNPKHVVKTTKRLKKQHRAEGHRISLRAWMRAQAEEGNEQATTWLANKSLKCTSKARKDRREASRIRGLETRKAPAQKRKGQ